MKSRSKPQPVKARKVTARRMWSTRGGHYAQHISSDECVKPVLVLDGSREGYEAMVEQMARALWLSIGHRGRTTWRAEQFDIKQVYLGYARAALASLSIHPPAQTK